MRNKKNLLTACFSFFSTLGILFSLLLVPSLVKGDKSPDLESKLNSLLQSNNNTQIQDWEARLELGRVLNNLKQYPQAEEQFRKALQEKPDAFEAKIGLAQALFAQGKKSEALQEMKNAGTGQLTDKETLTLADTYSFMKLYDEAEIIYKRYLNKFPNDDNIRFKLADMLSWEKRYDESIAQYRIILTHRPDDIQVRRKYAFVLMWMGNEKDAATELEKTLSP